MNAAIGLSSSYSSESSSTTSARATPEVRTVEKAARPEVVRAEAFREVVVRAEAILAMGGRGPPNSKPPNMIRARLWWFLFRFAAQTFEKEVF